ncbi:MAG: hypothetical protein RBT34_07020, partial [Anaerolineaceae bacterium]|nr:hypothetical protein [Anaerolineaceae bacterium]
VSKGAYQIICVQFQVFFVHALRLPDFCLFCVTSAINYPNLHYSASQQNNQAILTQSKLHKDYIVT